MKIREIEILSNRVFVKTSNHLQSFGVFVTEKLTRDEWSTELDCKDSLSSDDFNKLLDAIESHPLVEKGELDKKVKALSSFIGTSQTFANIDNAEQERLKEQCKIMWQYSEILGLRIAAFE